MDSLGLKVSRQWARYSTVPLLVLALVVGCLGFQVDRAGAAIAEISGGAATPLLQAATGFPLWYQDIAGGAGTRITPCLGLNPDGTGAPDPKCILLASPGFNPALPITNINTGGGGLNFPLEWFYYFADMRILNVGPTGQGRVDFRAVLEASFATATASPGQQVVFLRINLGAFGGAGELEPNQTYTVTHPFGPPFTFTSAADGSATGGLGNQAFRAQDGAAGLPPDFVTLLPATDTGISQFLANAVAPAGYLGDGVTPGPLVAGAPNGGLLTITGLSIGGIGVNSISSSDWAVSGKLFAPTISQVTPVPAMTNDTTPVYTFTTNDTGTIAYGGDCTSATTAAVLGNNTVTFAALANGLHNNCTITVTNILGNPSNVLAVTPFTVDTVPPVATQVAAVPTPTGDSTPIYMFNSNEAGTIVFGGGCTSATTTATAGNNAIAFRALKAGPHTGCLITVVDLATNVGNTLNVPAFTVRNVKNDFDGDVRSDIGCYFPTGGDWFEFRSAEGFVQTKFGFAGTLPITGDFDADGKSDIGAYNPPGGNWYLFKSTEGFAELQFGFAGTIPVVGDFDFDGKTDIGAYFAETGSWYLFKSTEGFSQTQFGFTGTIPVVGDFDGDGRDDIGAYYPPGGNWYLFKSTEGFFETAFGFAGTIPVVGDFDGDGRDDIGVYNPPGGNWYLFKSTEGFFQTTFGYAGTEPVVGDFDGDGRDDIAVYFAPGGNWYMFKSTEGFTQTTFGFDGTIPLGGTLR